jgi:hypothetical protein
VLADKQTAGGRPFLTASSATRGAQTGRSRLGGPDDPCEDDRRVPHFGPDGRKALAARTWSRRPDRRPERRHRPRSLAEPRSRATRVADCERPPRGASPHGRALDRPRPRFT